MTEMLYLFIFQNLSFFIRKYHKLLLQIIIQFIPICSKILYKRRKYYIKMKNIIYIKYFTFSQNMTNFARKT